MASTSNTPFVLWIDADACPREVRDIIELAALRRQVRTAFVANTPMRLHPSPYLEFHLVEKGDDKADDFIVGKAGGEDIVITADIPLAARLVERGVAVVSPRGEEMTAATIGDRLAMRNLLEELRGAGLVTGGPKEMDRGDVQRFANALDRALTRRLRSR
ncbi:MAG: YaiI/YqxD family protein [Planctomycetes bacterium]|nr:YaiI/YqxD family protein [Planctomycetota bacterium]